MAVEARDGRSQGFSLREFGVGGRVRSSLEGASCQRKSANAGSQADELAEARIDNRRYDLG